jgi:hypothetical protein
MGGRDSEVTNATMDLFLEVANFGRDIRTARRALGLSTDASYRFERGVDVEIAPKALERVAQIIMLLAGGSVAGAPVDLSGPSPKPARRESIAVRPERVSALLGTAISGGEVDVLLQSIGFDVQLADDHLRVTPPSWRRDVSLEVDLIEEVARLRGYDSFPLEMRPFRPGAVPDDPAWLTSKRVREALVEAGMLELRLTCRSSRAALKFARVMNPLAENEAYLRPATCSTSLRSARRATSPAYRATCGCSRSARPAFGRGATASGRGAPRRRIRDGRRQPHSTTDPKSPEFAAWAVYDAGMRKRLSAHDRACRVSRGEIEVVAKDENQICESLTARAARVHDDALWVVTVNGVPVGQFGGSRSTPQVGVVGVRRWSFARRDVASDDVAPAGKSGVSRVLSGRARPIGASSRCRRRRRRSSTCSFGPDGVRAADVETVACACPGSSSSVELFDRYVGAGVEPGTRSLACRGWTFRHSEHSAVIAELDAMTLRYPPRTGRAQCQTTSHLNRTQSPNWISWFGTSPTSWRHFAAGR